MAVSIVTTKVRESCVGNAKMFIGKSVIAGDGKTAEVTMPMDKVELILGVNAEDTSRGLAFTEDFPLMKSAATIRNEANNATTYWIAIGRG